MARHCVPPFLFVMGFLEDDSVDFFKKLLKASEYFLLVYLFFETGLHISAGLELTM